jgi:uncharacterized protein (TIGR03067 family)
MKTPPLIYTASLTLMAAGCWLSAADGKTEEATQKEFRQMAGAWVQGVVNWKTNNATIARMIYGREFEGQDPVALFQNRAMLLVQDGEFTFRNGNFTRTVKVTIDPTQQPKTIDFQIAEGQKLAGIYLLKKEWLEIAINSGSARPATISATGGEPPDFSIHFQSARSLMFPPFERAYQYDLPGLLAREDVRVELGMVAGETNQIERALAPVRENYDREVEKIAQLPPPESQPKFKLAKTAIRKEMVHALEKALKPGQMRRLKQLELQQRETDALFDPEVQAALDITTEQTAAIRRVSDKAMQDLTGKGQITMAVWDEANKRRAEKILATLTEAQRTKWREMVGAPFDFRKNPPKD